MIRAVQSTVHTPVRRAGQAVGIIDIQGAVTASAERALMQAWTEASQDGARTIILNFTELEYMNSSGIGLLITLLVRANSQGYRLLAFGLNPHYRQIFELTRLNEAIYLYDTEAEALAALS